MVGYLVASALGHEALGLGLVIDSKVRLFDLGTSSWCRPAVRGRRHRLMRGVVSCESALNWLRIRPVFRPVLGGLIVGLMALVAPRSDLASGHGAIHLSTMQSQPLQFIAMLFVLKALASIVSLGTGFRGGLFFASLLIGALGGRLFADVVEYAVACRGTRSADLLDRRHGRACRLGDRRAAHHDVHCAGDDRRLLADHGAC